MPASISHRSTATKAYLLLGTVPTPLALPAVGVLDIIHPTALDLVGAVPLDAIMPIKFGESEPAWVLCVGNEAESIRAQICGLVRLEYLSADFLVPMPSLGSSAFRCFSDVIVRDGRPSALVVNIGALLRLHQEQGA